MFLTQNALEEKTSIFINQVSKRWNGRIVRSRIKDEVDTFLPRNRNDWPIGCKNVDEYAKGIIS
jgi:hypothetical protein